MAEHFRDFLDPVIDAEAIPILEPDQDAAHRALAGRGGDLVLTALGAEKLPSRSDGEVWRFHDSEGHPAVMVMHEPDVVKPAIITRGDRGLFYGFTAHDEPLWTPDTDLTFVAPDIETGNPQPDGLVAMATALLHHNRVPRRIGWMAAYAAAPIRDTVARLRWNPSTERTKAEIAGHYDLSQDVYTGELGFLDKPYVQYSSGLLAPGHKFESLEELQRQKIDSLAAKLELDTASDLLEIGSGWAGLAVELALRYPNLHITSLTVSDEQLIRCEQRAKASGVDDRITFLGMDYRDYKPEKPFDRLVSVEMIEAVDWRDMGEYFDALTRFVNPDNGIIALQSINIKQRQHAYQRHSKSFLKTAIFPGGALIPKETIDHSMNRRGWQVHGEHTELGPSYALTLREFMRNLHAHKPALSKRWVEQGIPAEKIERFYRGFSVYLGFAEAAFRSQADHMQDWQLAYHRAARRILTGPTS